MTARYTIVKSARLKHVVIEGTTSYDELERLFLRYLRDPDFSPDLRVLADLRGMTDAFAGLWEIRKLKQLYQYAYHDAVGAVDVVIVTGKGLAHRAARAFQLLMLDKRPLAIRVTNCMAQAQEYLGLGDDVMRQLGVSPAADIIAFPRR